MDHLNSEYGSEKGQHVFYAMANKRKNAKPAFQGDLGDPQENDPTPMPPPPPPRPPGPMSQFDGNQGDMGGMPPQPTAGPPPMPTGGQPNPSMPPMPGDIVEGTHIPLEMQAGGPMPTPPMPPSAPAGPPPAPAPVVNTGMPPSPTDIGANPIYRRGLVAGLEKVDEGNGAGLTSSQKQSQIGQDPVSQAFTKEAMAYHDIANKKTPMWKEALGITLNSLGLPLVGHKLTGDDEKSKAFQLAHNMGTLAEEQRKIQTGHEQAEAHTANVGYLNANRDSLIENRKLLTETRAQNAATFADRLKQQANKQQQDWLVRELGSKERYEDATYQKQADPIEPGYIFYPDPSNPGHGFAAPPNLRPLPTELAQFVPGKKVGELITHSEYRRAEDANAKNIIEGTKAASKNDPNATLTGEVRTEIAGFGGDPSKKEDVARGLQLVDQKKRAGDKGTVLMLPTQDGGFKATSVKPGDTVAPGAVTPSGMSSANVPTANTRAMSEKAPRVIQFVDRINQLLDANEQQLGPLKSRWNEFTAGKVGLPNQGYSQIRTVKGLLTTALMNMHVGARGGADIMKHFDDLINTSVQDPDNLRAALAEIKAYAQSVAKEGSTKIAPAGSKGDPLGIR